MFDNILNIKINLYCTVADLSGVVTTSPPKPAGHNTAPPSGPVPTTAAPESPLVNVTAQPPMANITIPPTVEAITDLLNKDSVTESPDEKPPQHPGTVVIPQAALVHTWCWDLHNLFFQYPVFCDFQNYCQ